MNLFYSVIRIDKFDPAFFAMFQPIKNKIKDHVIKI